MSDTHGNFGLMLDVADGMRRHFDAECIFHLGDNYRDAAELVRAGYCVHRVPGLWCDEYHDSRIPKQITVDIEGLSVACAHAEKDLRHTERAAAIVLVGHTHEAGIVQLGRALYINPGHLVAPTNRGQPASFAVVAVEPDMVQASIHDAFSFAERRRMTVRRAYLG